MYNGPLKYLTHSQSFTEDDTMYRSEITRRGQGRGRGRGRGPNRGGQRSTPYSRPPRERTRQIPKATPDELLSGSSTLDRATSKAKNDFRVAKEWAQWFQTAFENDEITIPSPRNSHLVPKADLLKSNLDSILNEAKTKCKLAIEDHCRDLIKESEHKIQNPPCP